MGEVSLDIKSIFADALEKESSEARAAYLDATCGDNADLRKKIEALLTAYEESDDISDDPIIDSGMKLENIILSEQVGTVIGRYKLLEKIGEGGMAVVYMAEQQRPIHRKVALKIIKLGMDTKSVIARFEAERQALAMMDHANIAKVLDAGSTETGRPYFVMDLVPGLSITEYCDKNRSSIKERLRLFITVCEAVQHAHQKGIIHRDIKPTNIMVTKHNGKPVPKVIDFGIAKATNQRLTEKTLFTRYAHIIGTPAYMSPEQAELSDLDVDTRTDIYSLGVLLYELLTGTTPFSEEKLREAGYLQMQKIICEEEPTKPSTKLSTLGEALTDVAEWHSSSPVSLSKLIRGDLDWIVMKSLEKDRARRYDTASALGADIQRHLGNEPVQARAPKAMYRLQKLALRHKSQIAVALVIVALVSAVAITFSILYLSRFQRQKNKEFEHKRILSEAQRLFSNRDAIAALQRIEPILDSQHVGHNARFVHNQILRNAQDGIRRCSLEIETNPEDADNYLDRARYYYILDDTENVRTDMDRYRSILNPPEGTSAHKRWVKDLIRQQQDSRLLFGIPTNLGPTVNSGSNEWGSSISADGLELYFSINRTDGYGAQDLWVTTRDAKDDEWGTPVNLGPTVNSSSWDAMPRISTDGLSLYFQSGRSGGSGDNDLWVITRETVHDEWGIPTNLGPPVNTIFADLGPAISSDGLDLYFVSNRPGGSGSFDLWVTTRAAPSDPWGEPVNLGSTINSSVEEWFPSISADGLVLFFQDDNLDICLTQRRTTTESFGPVVKLPPHINTSGIEGSPYISYDGSTLYFSGQNRPGDMDFGSNDIWQVPIVPAVGNLEQDGDSDSAPESDKSNGGKEG
ncbi:MAG: protein kinase [Planctomycetes bacterium]|nr:protein kinase [Planctomycetota bacterium]